MLLTSCLTDKEVQELERQDTGNSADTSGDSNADGSGTPIGPGVLSLSFEMNSDCVTSVEANDELPVGTFHASIFAEADATSIGPNEGATPLLELSVSDVDLTGGGPTDVLWTSEPIDPQIVWVLGCLDLAEDGCDDAGDPITIPDENRVEIAPDADTAFTVDFRILRP